MTKKTLLVGCSFLSRFSADDRGIKIIGIPGVGNTIIAELVLAELATGQYDNVLILWTGINRIDIPIGKELADTFPNKYPHNAIINDTVWYASGGIDMSGSTDSCPTIPRQIFEWYYKSSNSCYLTNQGLSGVLRVQSYLKANNIHSQMAFIYDIHSNEYDTNWLCSVLGKVDTNAYTYKLINWENIQTANTPYEWSRNNNQLQDGFHPTNSAMIEWVRQNFQFNIANFERK